MNQEELIGYKTKPCPIEGCKKQTCVFYHFEGERRRTVNFQGRKCPKKSCPGESCKFAHTQNEFYYHPDNYMKKICLYYANGNCSRGKYCAFLHSNDNIEKIVDLVKKLNDKEIATFGNLLREGLDDSKRKILSSKLFKKMGWEEIGWFGGSKKVIESRIRKLKELMEATKLVKIGKMLQYGSLKKNMNSLRLATDALVNYQKEQSGRVSWHFVRVVKDNVNWSHHDSNDGEEKFPVTPDNQNKAIDNFEKLVNELLCDEPADELSVQLGNILKI